MSSRKYHASIEADTFTLLHELEQIEGIRVINCSQVIEEAVTGLRLDPVTRQGDLPNIPPPATQSRVVRLTPRRKAKPVTRRSKITLHDDTVLVKSRRGKVRDLPPQPKQAYNVWRLRNTTYEGRPITVRILQGLVHRKHPEIKSAQSVISNLVHRHGVLRALPE